MIFSVQITFLAKHSLSVAWPLLWQRLWAWHHLQLWEGAQKSFYHVALRDWRANIFNWRHLCSGKLWLSRFKSLIFKLVIFKSLVFKSLIFQPSIFQSSNRSNLQVFISLILYNMVTGLFYHGWVPAGWRDLWMSIFKSLSLYIFSLCDRRLTSSWTSSCWLALNIYIFICFNL